MREDAMDEMTAIYRLWAAWNDCRRACARPMLTGEPARHASFNGHPVPIKQIYR
jgi:hypothetical protein